MAENYGGWKAAAPHPPPPQPSCFLIYGGWKAAAP